MTSPWDDKDAPQTERELSEFSAMVVEGQILDGFQELLDRGLVETAWTLHQKLGGLLVQSGKDAA